MYLIPISDSRRQVVKQHNISVLIYGFKTTNLLQMQYETSVKIFLQIMNNNQTLQG